MRQIFLRDIVTQHAGATFGSRYFRRHGPNSSAAVTEYRIFGTTRAQLGFLLMHLPTQAIAGIRFAVADVPRAIRAVTRLAALGEPTHVHLLNAYSVALADSDAKLKELLNDDSALCFPDGKPVTWVSSALRQVPRLGQVRGPSVFSTTLKTASPEVRHYLLGGEPETLHRLLQRIESQAARPVVVGYESPPFREMTVDEQRAQDRRIIDSGANLVWVGLGTPKQDFEAQRITQQCGVTTVAVGAAFDFYAGTVREAPRVLQRMGLEWLFRLATEPRRLWRRYTLGSARFIVASMKAQTKS